MLANRSLVQANGPRLLLRDILRPDQCPPASKRNAKRNTRHSRQHWSIDLHANQTVAYGMGLSQHRQVKQHADAYCDAANPEPCRSPDHKRAGRYFFQAGFLWPLRRSGHSFGRSPCVYTTRRDDHITQGRNDQCYCKAAASVRDKAGQQRHDRAAKDGDVDQA